MNKAVLVIDIPNDLDVNDLLIDYCVHTKGKYKTIRKGGNHPLKPMPEKDEEPEDDLTDYVQQDYDRMASYFYGLINGRNDVINEILGETE